MISALKRILKARLVEHINREVRRASKDIELARQRRATRESANYVNRFMKAAGVYPDKFALLQAAISQVKVAGLFCEFGVFRGETINWIASLTSCEVHGFDSFEGLPEDWKPGHEKGTFAVPSLPEVRGNVRLHKGWFRDTLPSFEREYPGPVAFLHIDADLYSSTKYVFDMLEDHIVPGTVIQFDEFFNFPGWREGEYKAFCEFCEIANVKVEYGGYTRWGEQVMVRVLEIGRNNRSRCNEGQAASVEV